MSSFPDSLPLDPDDHALIAAAIEVLERHYRPFWHTVAAAVRGRDGRVWTGIHLGATVGRMSVCAEPIAVGRALLEGDGTVATIVAVRHPKPEETDREMAVVSPCGACREMIMDHCPDASVILRDGAALVKVPARLLLPAPYRRSAGP
ncbi:MAG: cytidine deaminase [Acetobacteraceae bacterium]